MTGRIKEAVDILSINLNNPDCEMCGNIHQECMWCEHKEKWCLSNKAAEMLVNKIEKILIPTGYWKRYEDDDEYYCSNCSFPAPRDTYGRFRDQPACCPACGSRMVDKENLELAKKYGE